MSGLTTEMADLLESLCLGELSPDDAARIEAMALGDEEFCRHYIRFVYMHALAERLEGIEVDPESQPEPMPSPESAVSADEVAGTPAMPLLGAPIDARIGFFSAGWPVAYLVATAIVGIGLLIGAAVHVSQPVDVVTQPASLPSPLSLPPSTVGRITDMIDCRWAEESTATINGAYVTLGRKYALSSGLMEISYDSGAKVVLQGPATYEVESPAGGYLSVGKLTARLEKKREGREEKGETARNVPSPLSTLHSPLFAVRTPTAIVTDLGTEFGVEVDRRGFTVSHVFRGSVRLETIPAGDETAPSVRILRANESAQVKRDGEATLSLHPIAVDPDAFVRAEQLPKHAEEAEIEAFHRWQAYSEAIRKDPSLLAYYDFQRNKTTPNVLLNVAAGGNRSLDGLIENARWTAGRMPGKHALVFNGAMDCVRLQLPQKTKDLTLAAWIRLYSHSDVWASGLLMSTGWLQPGQIHWAICKDGHIGFCGAVGVGNCDSSASIVDDGQLRRWIHLACVCDHAASKIRHYLDGRLVAEVKCDASEPYCIGPASIGRWDYATHLAESNRNFRGSMDELAIFGRPLAAAEVRRMFEAGRTEASARQFPFPTSVTRTKQR